MSKLALVPASARKEIRRLRNWLCPAAGKGADCVGHSGPDETTSGPGSKAVPVQSVPGKRATSISAFPLPVAAAITPTLYLPAEEIGTHCETDWLWVVPVIFEMRREPEYGQE
jgi:hypothetical protein